MDSFLQVLTWDWGCIYLLAALESGKSPIGQGPTPTAEEAVELSSWW
jgi:hypothetical protein